MKSNRCFIIIVVILILIGIPIDIEEEPKMKHYRYKDISITSAKKPQNTHLWVETNSSGIIYAVDSADNTNLIKTTDKGDNWSTVANRGKDIRALWHDVSSGFIYVIEDDRGNDDITIWYLNTSDDSENVVGADVRDALTNAFDIWIRDSNLEIMVHDTDTDDLEIWQWQDPNWVEITDGAITSLTPDINFSYIVVVGTDIYFWVAGENAIGNYAVQIIKYGGGAFNQLDTHATMTYPSSKDQWGIAYDGTNILFFVCEDRDDNKNYLMTYNITTDTIVQGAEYNIALQLDRNNRATVPNELEKAFGLSDEITYEIKTGRGGIALLQDLSSQLSGNIIAITDNFLLAEDGGATWDVYEFTEVSDEIDEIEYNNGIIGIPQEGFFIVHPDFQANWNKEDSIKIYDQFDVLEFWGIIKDKNRNEFGFYVFDIDAFSNEVYKTQYDNDYSGDDLDTKQKDIIDNACDFCYRSSSIVGTTTTFDYKYKRAIAYLFYLGRFLERQIPYIEPDGKIWTEAYNGQSKQPQLYPPHTFKDEVVGTQGTNIAWIDTALTTAATEIVLGTNGHKKILRQIEIAGNDFAYHTFPSAGTSGWYEFWAKVSDVTGDSRYELRESTSTVVAIQFDNSKIRYFDGNLVAFVDGIDAVNDRWYHIFIQWYDLATDTFDLWINGILIVSDIQCVMNQTTGVDQAWIRQFDAGDTMDIDAPISSLDNNPAYTVGDNSVGWELSNHWQNHRLIDIPDIRDIQTSYFDGNAGITRATVRYRDNIISTKPVAATRDPIEQLKGILPLKEFDDPKIEESTESDQLATNLYDIFSADTIFLALYVEDQGFMQPGRTLEIQNTGQITIAKDDYVILQYTRDPKNDRYYNMILSDNIMLTSEFKSLNDTSPKQLRTAIVQSFENQADIIAHLTREGGLALRLTNKTGIASIKGTIVEAHAGTDNAFRVCDANSVEAFGVVYEDGIADGSECLVIVGGRCQVLLKDATASTRGFWVEVSDVAGRADATGASPAASPQHFQEIGHCIESQGADTDVLSYIMLHFL